MTLGQVFLRREKMKREYEMPKDQEKPVLVIKWITETSVYPSGKVVQNVYPIGNTKKAFSKRPSKVVDSGAESEEVTF